MKNLLLTFAIMLTSAAAIAQLTVKPIGGVTENYIYVNNEVLFVTQGISLTPNPASITEPSIYLRNDGQLIQGASPVVNNQGQGSISVQQNTPFTNAWAYYYWCSPISYVVGIPSGNGNFGVGNLYESTGARSALKAQTTTALNGTTGPMTISKRWLYTHLFPGGEAAADYQRMNGGYTAPAGKGFIMKGVGLTAPGGDQIYEFRGRANNGNFTIAVGTGLMTLSGNPYPSSLDLNKLFYDTGNSNLGSLRYYDENRTVASHNYASKPYGYGVWVPGVVDPTPNNPNDGNYGSYTAAPFYYYNASGTLGGSAGTGSGLNAKRFAPVGQGIMFVGSGNGNVFIRNSQRIFRRENLGQNSVFQRPEGANATLDNNIEGQIESSNNDPASSVDLRDPQLRLYVVFDGEVTRDMLLTFSNEATDGYDRGIDGLHPMDLKSDAYFPIATSSDSDIQPYVIQGINYDISKKVPLTITLDKESRVEVLAVDEVKKPYENAYLFDNETNIYRKLTKASSGPVSGTLLPAGTYENRFYIVFRSPNQVREASEGTIATKTILQNVDFFQNNQAGQLEVSNPEAYTIKSASVYDMSGKLVISESDLGDNTKFSFYTGNLSDGIYLVKLLTSDDVSIDYKASVRNK